MRMNSPRRQRLLPVLAVVVLAAAAWLWAGTQRDPNFWVTADQRGDQLLRQQDFATAAETYANPWRIGVAQYRAGDFEAAARTFGRVPGFIGAFNEGNAWLLCGKYEAAIASYDRALAFWPGWIDAVENRDLAVARKAFVAAAGEDAAKDSAATRVREKYIADPRPIGKKPKPMELPEPARASDQIRLRRSQAALDGSVPGPGSRDAAAHLPSDGPNARSKPYRSS